MVLTVPPLRERMGYKPAEMIPSTYPCTLEYSLHTGWRCMQIFSAKSPKKTNAGIRRPLDILETQTLKYLLSINTHNSIRLGCNWDQGQPHMLTKLTRWRCGLYLTHVPLWNDGHVVRQSILRQSRSESLSSLPYICTWFHILKARNANCNSMFKKSTAPQWIYGLIHLSLSNEPFIHRRWFSKLFFLSRENRLHKPETSIPFLIAQSYHHASPSARGGQAAPSPGMDLFNTLPTIVISHLCP